MVAPWWPPYVLSELWWFPQVGGVLISLPLAMGRFCGQWIYPKSSHLHLMKTYQQTPQSRKKLWSSCVSFLSVCFWASPGGAQSRLLTLHTRITSLYFSCLAAGFFPSPTPFFQPCACLRPHHCPCTFPVPYPVLCSQQWSQSHSRPGAMGSACLGNCILTTTQGLPTVSNRWCSESRLGSIPAAMTTQPPLFVVAMVILN